MSYSICCSAEQSGAAGGGQASPHRGGGRREETEGERRGRQSAQHLSSTRKRSTAGQAQEKTLTLTHSQRRADERPGQRVEVKRGAGAGRGSGVPPLAGRSTRAQAGPEEKKESAGERRGVGPPSPVSFDSPATFPSPWGNGPFWRGCWRRLSSSTLP